MDRYSVSEFVKNVYSFSMMKLTFPKARFIRRPIYVRGKKSIDGGIELTTGYSCRFDLDGKKKTLYIGDRVEMGDMTHIVALNRVVIGNDVLIASKCFISDTSHGSYSGDQQDAPETPPNKRTLFSGEVIIGDNVWIGENAVILRGAEIGEGSIIGANAIVTKKIPNNSIVVGSNRIIKKYSSEINKWVEVGKENG